MGSTYEGLQRTIRSRCAPAIEVWKNVYADRDYCITVDIPEFTSMCPKTALPDFAVIVIKYVPDAWCLELKSLKYYTLFYRQLGIFNENVVNKILDDCVKAGKPRWMEVVGEFNARGGIKTTVRAEYKKGRGGRSCVK